MRKLTIIISLAISLSFTTILVGCGHKTEAWNTMDKVEELMVIHPDSALELMSSLDKDRLGNSEEKARYALLMSMALDKNYIDTTTLDVLQPAIDYYLSNGNPDEKLRTLYYQGRIYQNCMDYDNAPKSIKIALLILFCYPSIIFGGLFVCVSIRYNEIIEYFSGFRMRRQRLDKRFLYVYIPPCRFADRFEG